MAGRGFWKVRFKAADYLVKLVIVGSPLSGSVTPSRHGSLAGLTLPGMNTFPCPVKGASNPTIASVDCPVEEQGRVAGVLEFTPEQLAVDGLRQRFAVVRC